MDGNETAGAGRVLVTGGAGFVGANLVRLLLNEGWPVRVLDDVSTGNRAYLHGLDVELIIGDVRDREMTESALHDCQYVVHLAAKTTVQESIKDPWPSFNGNVEASLALLEACRGRDIRRVVFASSNAAVGEQPPPMNEQMVPRPLSPYGASKLAAEAYCSAYSGAYSLPTVVLRFSNVYGPYSGHKTSVVAKFLLRAIAGDPLVVYGDGRQTRDYIYVEDVARAIVLALKRGGSGETFQIATGKEVSVLDLISTIGQVTGMRPQLEWASALQGEIRRNYASGAKARRHLSFAPRVGLHEGVALTYEFLTRWKSREGRALRERAMPPQWRNPSAL